MQLYRAPLTKHALADNLAVSLTRSDWSERTLHAALRRRLPTGFEKTADGMAKDLITALPAQYAPAPKKVAKTLVTLGSFGRFYHTCRRRSIWPAPDLAEAQMAPIDRFQSLDLPRLTTLAALADWLLIEPDRLTALADPQNRRERHGDMAVNHYHRRLVPKRDGEARLLEAPKQRLKAAQRHILHGLLAHLPNHPNAFGFIAGRNCLQAAQRHVGEAVVLRFDLKDFFPSLHAPRVFGLFRCLGYPNAVAGHLTALCTTVTPPHFLERLPPASRPTLRVPHLPQGAPTSPALANQLCHGLDRRLSTLARSLGAHYSRYADDLTFSGNPRIAKALHALVPQIVKDEGLHLNPAKTRTMPNSARQSVTGLTVNQHLNISRKRFDQLKAVIHACSKPDDIRLTDARFRAHLLGQINWVESVNQVKGAKLRRLLEKTWNIRFPQALH